MSKIRVYVAGPISKGDLNANINQARAAGIRLMRAGFAPWVPHLSCYMAGDIPEVLPHGTVHEDWYGMDIPFVQASDAVLRLPGESTGADLEVAEARRLGIPVYYDAEELIANPPGKGDARFHDAIRSIALLHDRKQKDYGTQGDPFANVRASEQIGIPAWKGAYLRLRDKIKRLDNYCLKGNLANESAEDSMQDISVYALIMLILHREAMAKEQPK